MLICELVKYLLVTRKILWVQYYVNAIVRNNATFTIRYIQNENFYGYMGRDLKIISWIYAFLRRYMLA